MSVDTRPDSSVKTAAPRRATAFALFSIIAGAIGWFASFELITEYIKTLQDPGYAPNCNISILVTCGPNMGAWQGSILGFSNTIIGVSAFAAPVAVGVALLAGARFSQWFWRIYQVGLLGGFALVMWLFSQSVYDIGTLCPWCMVVWTVTIPLFWFTLFYPDATGQFRTSERTRGVFRQLLSWAWVVVLVLYLVIAFLAQIELDWFAEFGR